MSKAIDNLDEAQRKAISLRPKIGGFPYLAETLRRAGVMQNIWFLPSCQSLYLTSDGPVMIQGSPIAMGTMDIAKFNHDALIAALRADQAGKTSFSEFLIASWHAGVIRYDVDFIARTVTYFGCNDEKYVESYPSVEIS